MQQDAPLFNLLCSGSHYHWLIPRVQGFYFVTPLAVPHVELQSCCSKHASCTSVSPYFCTQGFAVWAEGWEGALLVTLSTLHAQSQGCGMLVHPHCRPGDVFAGCKQCKHPGNRKGSITKHSQRNPCSCCPSNYVAEHHTCQPHPDMPCQCDFHTKETLRLVDKVRTLQKPVSGT